jgi:hypothetical protein
MTIRRQMGRIVWMTLLLALGACSTSSSCPPGAAGCACQAQMCNAGLSCLGGTCRAESHTNLAVDGKARACEVLLHETGGKIDGVAFDASATGRWLRQGDKVAAAFAAVKDAPIGAVAVAWAGPDAASAFEVVGSHCYGADGVELAGATVRR